MKKNDNLPLVIIGAGPIGLALACSLAKTALNVVIIDKQSLENLASPSPDGRDIALSGFSRKILNDLGVLPQIPSDVISPIKEARVLNGNSPHSLYFDANEANEDALGYLTPNYLIRKALFNVLQHASNCELITETFVTQVDANPDKASVTLSNGETINAALIVAADGRFSKMRSKLGISAAIKDFGHSAIVCKMAVEKPHNNVAHECFHYGRTLAVLPLADNQVSIIITTPTNRSDEIYAMPEDLFSRDIQRRFENRLGDMKLVSERYTYPLVSVYANRFIKPRFALLGDAAVAMHPVTAHGFNFGLRGQYTLAKLIQSAIARGQAIGDLSVLRQYQVKQRQATRPLYLLTNTIVKLFTNDAAAPKLLRKVLLRCCNHVVPVKRAIIKHLAKERVD